MTKLFHSFYFTGMQELSTKLNEMQAYCTEVKFIQSAVEINGALQQQKLVAFIEVIFDPKAENLTPTNFCDKFNIPKPPFV